MLQEGFINGAMNRLYYAAYYAVIALLLENGITAQTHAGVKQMLEQYDEEQRIERNLDFRFLVLVYMVMFVAFLLILPKIYIKNQIYYMSRDINKLYGEYSILKEENRVLKQNLENIRFKNQILDTIYIE